MKILLLEDIAAVRKLFPTIKDNVFDNLIRLDPTFVEGRNSVGRYGKWILNLYKRNGNLDLFHITDLLNRFEEEKPHLKIKDIGHFKSLEDVDRYLNDEDSYTELSHRQRVRDNQNARKNVNLKKDAELVFDSDMWQVYVPKTYAASCKLGQGTTWCTASTESDYYYKDYSQKGPLYINIHKVIPDEKYQFHFETEQFMDSDDRPIDIFDFIFEQHKELLPFYNKIICEWLELGEDSDLSEYHQVTYDSDDLYHILNDNHGGDVNGDTVVKLLTCPEEIYGEWDFSYVELTNDLIDLLNEENKTLIINKVGSLNISDIEDDMDVFGTLLNGAQLAFEEGSISEARRDALKALHKSVSDVGTGSYDNENGEFTVTYIPYQVLKDYYSRYSQYFNNIIKDSIAQVIEDNYRLFEPQYGWNEFNENTFNDYVKDNL